MPFRAPLKLGTEIVSSGLGGTYPRGIHIGTVIGELQTTEKWVRTYMLKPAVLPNTPGPVLLIIPSRAAKDMNGVWTNIASSDSASRSIVMSGDSMAKKAALEEIAARRAVDSVAVDSLRGDSLAALGLPRNTPVARPDTTKRDTTKKAKPDSIPGKPKPTTGPPPPIEERERERSWP